MSKHDVGYFRQRRRARGIPVREISTAPNSLQQATEPRGVEQLPWPRNLFGEPASIAELLAEAARLPAENADDECPCGCCKEHRNNVSQTLRNPYGSGFDVVYFWSDTCKTRWNRQRMLEPANG